MELGRRESTQLQGGQKSEAQCNVDLKKSCPEMAWATKPPDLRWVSTDAHDIVVHEGTEWRAAFFRLFNYIDGTNSEDTKIPMTKPVSARYIGSVK